MKTYITFILSFILCYNLSAQHDILNLTNTPNNVYLNPASTGYENTFISTLTFRNDQTGTPQSPKTISFSGHCPLNKEEWSAGIFIMNDRFGPTRQFHLSGLLSHKIKMKFGQLSLGIRTGIQNHKLDESSLITTVSNDPELNSNSNTTTIGLGFGVLFKSDLFYIGISAPETSSSSSSEINSTSNELSWNKMFSTGFNYTIQEKINLAMHLAARQYGKNYIQLQAIPEIEYDDNLKVGIIFRGTNNLGMTMSYWINEKINLAYAFEKNTGNMITSNNSNHEISFSYRLKETVNTFNPKSF